MESKIIAIHEAVHDALIDDDAVITTGILSIMQYIDSSDNIGVKYGIPAATNTAINFQADFSTQMINLPSGEYSLDIVVTVPEKVSAAPDVRDSIAARIDYLMNKSNLNFYSTKNLRCRTIQRLNGVGIYDAEIQAYTMTIMYRMVCGNETLVCT